MKVFETDNLMLRCVVLAEEHCSWRGVLIKILATIWFIVMRDLANEEVAFVGLSIMTPTMVSDA